MHTQSRQVKYNKPQAQPESKSVQQLLQEPVFYLRVYDPRSDDKCVGYISSHSLTRLMIKVINKSNTLHDRGAVRAMSEIVRAMRYIMTFSKRPSVSLPRIEYICAVVDVPFGDYVVREVPL